MEDHKAKKPTKKQAIQNVKDNVESTLKENFVKNMLGNEFVAYVIITEKMMNKIESMCGMDLFNQVKKMTTNYRRWNDVVEYIEQCYDIMEDRMCNA